jgi:hypothetical protein
MAKAFTARRRKRRSVGDASLRRRRSPKASLLGVPIAKGAKLIGAIAILSLLTARAHPQDADQALRLDAVHIEGAGQQSGTGNGVYLGNGLVLTAAHVAGSASSSIRLQIGGRELPADIVKRGQFPDLDLALLSVDEHQLPASLQLRHLTLCTLPPWPGDAVIVATPEGTARSHVMPPALLPRDLAAKFRTAIADVATTGMSGSGVFDVNTKCLLGIISGKIRGFHSKADVGHDSQAHDVAKYFVPAPVIAEFLPRDVRF